MIQVELSESMRNIDNPPNIIEYQSHTEINPRFTIEVEHNVIDVSREQFKAIAHAYYQWLRGCKC